MTCETNTMTHGTRIAGVATRMDEAETPNDETEEGRAGGEAENAANDHDTW
jgi:hypothetical protein